MLRAVVDSLWLVADGSLQPFEDDLDGYAKWLATGRQQASSAEKALDATATESSENKDLVKGGGVDKRQQKRDKAQIRAKLAPLTKAISKHEASLEKASAQLADIREQLSADDIYSQDNKDRLNDLLGKEVDARKQVENIEEQLLESMEALEQATVVGND